MTDDSKAAPDRRSARSQRKSPEIELKAVETTVLQSAEASNAPIDPVSTDSGLSNQTETPPDPPGIASIDPDIIAPPPPLAPKRSIGMPMAIAALAGGLLGTAGGSLLPSLTGSGPAVNQAEIQKLRQTVAALEARPAPTQSPGDGQALQQRLAVLEGDLSRRIAEAEKRLADRVVTVETGMKAVESRVESPAQSAVPPLDITPLTQRLGTLEQGLKALDGKAEAAIKAAEPRIVALSERVETATRRIEAGTAAPLFTAVQGLAQAFHRGTGFSSELAAVELMGAKSDQLRAIKVFAERGAPTLQQLTAGFAPFAGSLAQSGEAAPGGAMAFLQRFVKVRPVGEIDGNMPPDIVRTVEAALTKGNVGEALTAWSKLPEAARAPSAAWAKTAAERDAAANALAALQESAIAALRTAKP